MALSEELGLPEDARLLVSRGCARCDLGDAGGVDDLRAGAGDVPDVRKRRAREFGLRRVGNLIYMYEGFQASLAVCTEGLDFARRRGAVDDEAEIAGRSSGRHKQRRLGQSPRRSRRAGAARRAGGATLVGIGWPSCAERTSGRSSSWRGDVRRRLATLGGVARGQRSSGEPTHGAGVYVAAAAAHGTGRRGPRAEPLGRREPTFAARGVLVARLLPDAVRIALAGGDRASCGEAGHQPGAAAAAARASTPSSPRRPW